MSIDAPTEPAPRRSRKLLIIVALLLPLLGAVTYLVLAFSPLADAAGGCGGG